MTYDNMRRRQSPPKIFGLLFQEFLRIFVFLFRVTSHNFIPSILSKLVACISKFILFTFLSYSLNNATTFMPFVILMRTRHLDISDRGDFWAS